MLDERVQRDASSLSAVCHKLITTGLGDDVVALDLKQNQGVSNHET